MRKPLDGSYKAEDPEVDPSSLEIPMHLMSPQQGNASSPSLEELRRARLEDLLLQAKPEQPSPALHLQAPPGIQSHKR